MTVKGLKRRVLPELDDEFAKDLGEFDTLDALKARDPRGPRTRGEARSRPHAARRSDEAAGAARAVRGADRRWSSARSIGGIEEFARRLMDQNVDPRQAGIDWNAFRGEPA